MIDFIPHQRNVSLKDVSTFDRAPGGAPANVAAAAACLGLESVFIGKLGNDAFGDFLVETLKMKGVNVSYIKRTDEANTALAFVSLREDGERDFSFYRNPSADMLLRADEIEQAWFENGDILHFCSVDLIDAPVKGAHLKAIEYTEMNGGLISFDPNIRLSLWPDQRQLRQTINEFIPRADLLKVSHDEYEFITGLADEEEAVKKMFQGKVKLIIVTKGPGGASAYFKDMCRVNVPGFKVDTVDSTGAGDAFIGAFIYYILQENFDLEDLTTAGLEEAIRFANAAGALTASRRGAISSLPVLEEVEQLVRLS